MEDHLYNKFRKDVEIVLNSKLDEFKLYDYDHITPDDLWQFLITKKWKEPREDIHIYEIVSDILSLKVSDFMTFQTVEHLKGPDWFSEEGLDDLKDLLKK